MTIKTTVTDYANALSAFFNRNSLPVHFEAYKRYPDSEDMDAMEIIVDDILQAQIIFLGIDTANVTAEILYHDYTKGHTEEHFVRMQINELTKRVEQTIESHKEVYK